MITGANGFAGVHLARHLISCSDSVIACSRTATWPKGAEKRIAEIPILSWDVGTDPAASFISAIEDFSPDVIYHLAAISHPRDCGRRQPTPEAFNVNVTGTKRVVDLACNLGSRPVLLFVSSSKVYGKTVSTEPLQEESETSPNTGYGVSKLMAENVISQAASAGMLKVAIARAFQHTGTGQAPTFLLPEWAAQFAQRANPVKVISQDVTLDLSDVRDVVAAYRLLATKLRSQKAPVQTVNVGSGKIITGASLWSMLCQFANYKPEILESNPQKFLEPIADVSALQELGWQPKISLEQTIHAVLNNWEHN
jgi:nucleoside-diphosphate-sugar epimerase